jgi:hypothetical protein
MTVDKLLREAKEHYEAGELVRAAQIYRHIVQEIEPDNIESLYSWACIAFERQNLENSEKLLLRATEASLASQAVEIVRKLVDRIELIPVVRSGRKTLSVQPLRLPCGHPGDGDKSKGAAR